MEPNEPVVDMNLGDEIQTREELATFVRGLREEFLRQGQEWENADLDTFLEALAAWIDDAEGSYRDFGKELPREGDWTFFAQSLRAATMYE
ncbi:hypothetical protein GCM10010334_62060 [Streptomyces finlayi]|uniref:DUF7660 domain-containing protein n=1 Tax=Streptomyces finlayi TaxID=67296 RepID=A0A918X3K0_9ACTN|nr:hypothetical protein [Streptomyces finlayi]GHD08597.1 hypothetical protein GCM10010334_62060 [Streptomyces finlayi]